MPKKRVLVLISGSGTNLQAIIDATENGSLDADIVGVIANRTDAYGLQRAQQHDIAHELVSSSGITSREQYDAMLMESIDAFTPDIIVLAGFMRILTHDLVNRYLGKMINIHPSLLPKYKGLHTHQRAIDAGDSEHGTSVHFVTPELDGGPIIVQGKVPVLSDDDATILANRVQTVEHQLYPQVVGWLCESRLAMRDNHAYLDNKRLPPQGFFNE